MANQFYITSLVSIIYFVSEELVQCDEETRITELFSDDFDDLDFELSLTCFEATHKVAFKEKLWEKDIEDYEEMTIAELLEEFLDTREQKDALFVTKRFLLYERSLADAIREEYEGTPPPEEY